MKKIIFIFLLLLLLIGCAHIKPNSCDYDKTIYPEKCIISIHIKKDTTDIKILNMIRDICGIRGENECYIINLRNENEFVGWSFICFR